MQVTFFCVDDWAGVGEAFAEAMRGQGVSAVSINRRDHPFIATKKSERWKTLADLQAFANRSDVVVLMHSEQFKNVDFSGKKVAVFHGGSKYRRYYRKLNTYFDKICDVALVQTMDLMRLGARNAVWLIPPVDTEKMMPEFKYFGRKFAHYPSNPRFKGTDAIVRCAAAANVTLDFSIRVISRDLHLERVKKCDIYVERMAMAREGKPTGIWGMSALEAAALGKVVITNDVWREEYVKEFGSCPMISANSEADLISEMQELSKMEECNLLWLKVATRRWVKRRHSFEAVGERLAEVLL